MNGLREIGESAANAVLERVGRGVSKVQERRPLSYDLLESDDAFLVVFDAPGATREDVEVRFHDNEVRVEVERFRGFHEGFRMRLPGRGLSLSGTAELPAGAAVEPTEASATVSESGTLQIRIPKEGSARSIAVGEEEDAKDSEVGTLESAESDVVDAVTDRDLDPADEADVDPSPDDAGTDAETGGESVESAESDVVDAVTDRDLDPVDEDGDRDGLDEEAGDYGGSVTGDETNTGAVDVAEDDEADAEDDDRDGA